MSFDFIGAGVLPYYYDREKRESFFLLGKEKWCQKFSDFGGRPENGEAAIQTAARECFEELGEALGSEITIRSLLDKSTPFFIPKHLKDRESLYVLYLLQLQPDTANKVATSFKPNEEKVEVRRFSVDELLQELSKQESQLRDAFKNELYYIPIIQARLQRQAQTTQAPVTFFPQQFAPVTVSTQ